MHWCKVGGREVVVVRGRHYFCWKGGGGRSSTGQGRRGHKYLPGWTWHLPDHTPHSTLQASYLSVPPPQAWLRHCCPPASSMAPHAPPPSSLVNGRGQGAQAQPLPRTPSSTSSSRGWGWPSSSRGGRGGRGEKGRQGRVPRKEGRREGGTEKGRVEGRGEAARGHWLRSMQQLAMPRRVGACGNAPPKADAPVPPPLLFPRQAAGPSTLTPYALQTPNIPPGWKISCAALHC